VSSHFHIVNSRLHVFISRVNYTSNSLEPQVGTRLGYIDLQEYPLKPGA